MTMLRVLLAGSDVLGTTHLAGALLQDSHSALNEILKERGVSVRELRTHFVFFILLPNLLLELHFYSNVDDDSQDSNVEGTPPKCG